MKTLTFTLVVLMTTCFLFTNKSFAQEETQDDVHLFKAFFRDATVATSPYLNAKISFQDFEAASLFGIGPQVGIPITSKIELGTELYYLNINPDGNYDSRSGISDIQLYGRYLFTSGKTKIAVGPYLSLPTQSSDLGDGSTNFGFFGAIRHPISAKVDLTVI